MPGRHPRQPRVVRAAWLAVGGPANHVEIRSQTVQRRNVSHSTISSAQRGTRLTTNHTAFNGQVPSPSSTIAGYSITSVRTRRDIPTAPGRSRCTRRARASASNDGDHAYRYAGSPGRGASGARPLSLWDRLQPVAVGLKPDPRLIVRKPASSKPPDRSSLARRRSCRRGSRTCPSRAARPSCPPR